MQAITFACSPVDTEVEITENRNFHIYLLYYKLSKKSFSGKSIVLCIQIV